MYVRACEREWTIRLPIHGGTHADTQPAVIAAAMNAVWLRISIGGIGLMTNSNSVLHCYRAC